jgi:LPXTG-motif cell wall-anchored protein
VYKLPGAGGVIGGGTSLALTGADVAWWIALGVLLVLSGLFLLRKVRRQDAGAADSAGQS